MLSAAPAAPQRRDDAERQPERELAEDRAGHQQEARGQPRRDQRGDLAPLQVGAAEIALQEVRQVAPVLLVERQVEAELAADVRDCRRRRAAAGDLPRRVGRQDVEKDEGDERDPEEDQRRLHQTPGEIGRHQ